MDSADCDGIRDCICASADCAGAGAGSSERRRLPRRLLEALGVRPREGASSEGCVVVVAVVAVVVQLACGDGKEIEEIASDRSNMATASTGGS